MKSWRSRAQPLVRVLSQRLEIDWIQQSSHRMLMSGFGTKRTKWTRRMTSASDPLRTSGRWSQANESPVRADPSFEPSEPTDA